MAETIITALYIAFLASFALVLWLLCRSPRPTQPDTTPAPVLPADELGTDDGDGEQLLDDLQAHLKAYATRIADLYDTTPGGNQ
ncbi:hypothetical protein ACIQSP_16665 [Streptomyces nigra]|uniref:hypothetical protein n=1 Tax=Streptomyces nigra TaxID=1827580 RepID=UPI003803F7C7